MPSGTRSTKVSSTACAAVRATKGKTTSNNKVIFMLVCYSLTVYLYEWNTLPLNRRSSAKVIQSIEQSVSVSVVTSEASETRCSVRSDTTTNTQRIRKLRSCRCSTADRLEQTTALLSFDLPLNATTTAVPWSRPNIPFVARSFFVGCLLPLLLVSSPGKVSEVPIQCLSLSLTMTGPKEMPKASPSGLFQYRLKTKNQQTTPGERKMDEVGYCSRCTGTP